MPATTIIIPENYPIEGLDQWAELITAAAGAGMKAAADRRAKKSAKKQEKADIRMMQAQEAAAKAAQLQTSAPTPWLNYALLGVGVIAVGVTVILLVKK